MSFTHNGDYNIVDEAVKFLLQQRHTYLWFLPVLFLSEIAVYALYKIGAMTNIKSGLALIVALVLTHFILWHYNINDLIWNIDLVPIVAAFILMGYLYRSKNVPYRIESNWWFIALVFIISVMVATGNFLYFGSVDMYDNRFGYYPLFIIGAVTCSYFLILLLKHIRIPRWLTSIGMASILLYGLHRIVIDILNVVAGKAGLIFDGSDMPSVIMALFNITLVCILLLPGYRLITKRAPWILGKF